MSLPGLDRRLHQRHPASVLVRATKLPGWPAHRAVVGRTVNFGIGGCAVKFDTPTNLRPKQRVHLAMVTTVNGVAQVYHRFGTVVHVTKGIVGFATEVWSAQAERDLEVWLKK